MLWDDGEHCGMMGNIVESLRGSKRMMWDDGEHCGMIGNIVG